MLCAFVLMVAFSMAELTSRYPTAGGPYWWAHDLGGKGWSWMTGWFNIVGLVGIVASVGYGAATLPERLLGLYGLDIFGVNFGDDEHILGETWLLFFLILVLYTLVNIFADRGLALMNNISVGWHLLGVAVIIGVLIFVPDDHQSVELRLQRADQQLRLARRLHEQPRLLAARAADRLPARRCTRRPATTPRLTPPRRRAARRSPPPRASGARSSSRR